MSGCPSLGGGGSVAGIATALRSIDCRTGETTAYAFGRLFGADGRLMPVLTALLTLYVAFFAISLLTGRSRLGVSALTPKMLTLGLVLTFATSWAAYQNVVWSLASGAPDQVATLLAGTRGSATIAFADRLDLLFGAVADAAHQAATPGPATETGITPATPMVGGFSASTALWVSALLLMLGTAGVLVTAKIALAALLAIGPLFVMLALFGGTRGLFEGWLRAVVLFALVPLFAVLIGGGAVAALAPVVQGIAAAGGQPDPHDVAVLFLGTCVYCALMAMVLRTAGTIVGGWRLPGSRSSETVSSSPVTVTTGGGGPAVLNASGATPAAPADDRVRRIVAAIPASAEPVTMEASSERGRVVAARIVSTGGETARPAYAADRRSQGVGSRFRTAPPAFSKGHVV